LWIRKNTPFTINIFYVAKNTGIDQTKPTERRFTKRLTINNTNRALNKKTGIGSLVKTLNLHIHTPLSMPFLLKTSAIGNGIYCSILKLFIIPLLEIPILLLLYNNKWLI